MCNVPRRRLLPGAGAGEERRRILQHDWSGGGMPIGDPTLAGPALRPAGQVFAEDMPPLIPPQFCPHMMQSRLNAWHNLYVAGVTGDAKLDHRTVESFRETALQVDQLGRCQADLCAFESCPSARGGMGATPQEELLRLREKSRAIHEEWIAMCEMLGCVSCRHADREKIGHLWPCTLDDPADIDEETGACKSAAPRQPGDD
jgi:hypothetical protein